MPMSSPPTEAPSRRDLPEAVGWALLLLGLAGFVAWSATHLGFFTWSIDEGMYLQRARMWAAGFQLYEDIWFNHPPLMVVLTRAVFSQLGESVEAGRMVAVAFATIGLAAIVLIARELVGWWAGLWAGLVLVLSPLFLGLSRALMTTLPALCMATAALWLVLRYRATGRRGWLVASGLAFGWGLGLKFIGAPVIVPIALAIAWPRRGEDTRGGGARGDGASGGGTSGPSDAAGRARSSSALSAALRMLRPRPLLDVLLWGLVGGVALLAVLAPFGLAALLPQTVGSVVGARDAFGLDLTANIQDVLEWLSEGHQGLAALGLYGIARGVWRDERWWLVVAWLAAAALAVLLQTPLWSHHLVFFSLPLAVGAGAGARWAVADVVAAAGGWRRALVGGERGASVVTAGQAAAEAREDATVDARALDSSTHPSAVGPTAEWLSFGLVSLLVFLFALPVALRRDAETTERGSEDPWTAVEMLRPLAEEWAAERGVDPGEAYVITDSPMIAFRAGLRVPPNLTDPGAKRFASGDLTLSEVTRDAQSSDPVALVTWNERLAKRSRQRLPMWLGDSGWSVHATLDEGRERRIWLPPETAPEVQGALAAPADWADGVRLSGLQIAGLLAAPGQTLLVDLFWTPTPATSADGTDSATGRGDYTVFTHLLDEAGTRWAQQDNPPGHGVRRTDTWLDGEVVVDRYTLAIDPGAPRGADFRLLVGLYDSETGEALRLEDEGSLAREGEAVVIVPSEHAKGLH